MAETKVGTFVVYCSPAGTTGHVAKVIGQTLAAAGDQVTSLDLGRDRGRAGEVLRQIADAAGNVCLYIGSPVYSSHALPPVMEFIARLPRRDLGYAVPFVTWGKATSGLALYEMGKSLNAQGFPVIAAAKVVAVHSLMWQVENPVGQGHPDAADDAMVRKLVGDVRGKMRGERPLTPLSDMALAYQSPAAHEEMMKLNLKVARTILPRRLVSEKQCSQCGVCVDECPGGAITLNPYPVFDDDCCILCFNCMRLCPLEAISADLTPIYDRIEMRGRQAAEQPLSQLFLDGD